MYAIIQFYYQLRYDLAEHRPFIKVLSIKLVIFLSFWQTVGRNCSLQFFSVLLTTPSDNSELPNFLWRHQRNTPRPNPRHSSRYSRLAHLH
jgi:hypothetical protein